MTRGLLVSIMLASTLAAPVSAQDCAETDGEPSKREAPRREDRNDRGWVIGGGLTGGNLSFPGAGSKAVAVGPAHYVPTAFGAGYAERPIALIDAAGIPPEETVHVARFPESQGAAAMTFHAGYAFSPRAALLLEVEYMGSPTGDFGNGIVAGVLRYRPMGRIWIEAGPASGDIGYTYEGTLSETGAISGAGFLAAAGMSLLERPRWTLDVQARYGQIWYDGFQARNVSFGLSVGRVRSGRPSKPAARAAAPRDGASRG
jgi:hypothetical protein